MCGIAGIINFKNEEKHSINLKEMANALKHRGPDDEGFMLFSKKPTIFFGDDSKVKNSSHINTATRLPFKVGFGFRQLKIIDLSNKSHQPLTDETEKYCIIFNGELYNYKEIRKELKLLNYNFKSDSDTEVVLKAYIEWGAKALEKFNGMFAFAILDSVKNNVFFARDRMGVKPFYFFRNNHYFVFGSTVKSIINSKIYNPEVNWEGLWQNYRFTTAQRPNTVFNNISALKPGHCITIDLNTNTVDETKYWEIPTQIQDFSLTEKQSINLIEESLYKAINYRLISDVEVGSFMSGGIDSSLISVIASKKIKNIKTLTLGFKEFEELNEVNQAKETAKKHHLNHVIHYANINESIKYLNKAIIAYEEPYCNISANLILAKMASKNNVKVVLSGLGGDELFGGYDVFKKIPLWKTLHKNRKIINSIPNFHQKIKKGKKIANCNSLGEYYTHYYTHFYDSEIDSLFKNHSFNTNFTLEHLYENDCKFTDTFEAMSFYNLKSYISNHQMRALDTTTMAFSIEGRFPLLDHNFIENAFKIPTKFKFKNNSQKYILKEIAKKHLTENTLKMPKKGLSFPMKNWVNNELKEFTFDNIDNLKKRNVFDKTSIEKIIKSNDPLKIWQLVSTELWLQNFIDK